MPNKELTELVLIVDDSGSMSGIQLETINNINQLIHKQWLEQENVHLTLALFNNTVTVIADGAPLQSSNILNTRLYSPKGNTALLDAIMQVIRMVGQRLARTEEAERPTSVIVAIVTDGEENSSKRYNTQDVADCIAHQRIIYNWQFIFLGANQESWATVEQLNIDKEDTRNWTSTPVGVSRMAEDLDQLLASKKRFLQKYHTQDQNTTTNE